MKDIAWIAGLFEGEGCISISQPSQRKNGRKTGGRVGITVSNTESVLLTPFIGHYGGKVKPYKEDGNRRASYRWRCPASIRARMLQELIPHLLGKRRKRAEVALEYLECIRPEHKSGWLPLTSEEKEKRLSIYERFYFEQ